MNALEGGGVQDWLARFASVSATLFVDSAPYLLVGFALAGLLKVFVPARLITRHLGRNDLRSVLLASLYGTPVPLCSCSVLPTAAALRRAGASKGATTSFLISTPETGVDSVSITWALFDPILTVARPAVAFLTAAITGSAVNVLERGRVAAGGDAARPGAAAGGPAAAGPGPEDDLLAQSAVQPQAGATPQGRVPGSGHEHGHEHDHADDEERWERAIAAAGPLERLRLALRYAFGPLLDDITPWLVVGLLVSGVIAASVPSSFFEETLPRGLPALLVMAALGTPLYVCATASTPIAATLVAKGLEPGAALVFLLVGPATNAATLAVVGGLLGRRVLWVYVSGIVLVALGAGLWINALYTSLGIDLAGLVSERAAEPAGAFALAVTLGFGALLAVSIWRSKTLGWIAAGAAKPLALFGLDPRTRSARSLPLVLLALVWLASSATTLTPGETGFRLRFGRLVETLDRPGLHVGWPWPIERVERVRSRAVAAVSSGVVTEAAARAAEQLPPAPPGAVGEAAQATRAAELRTRYMALHDALELEAEMLTADEVLLAVGYSVHYHVRDARRVLFAIDDANALVRALASSAVRRSVAARDSSSVLVGAREMIQREATAALQRDLDRIEAGLQVVGVWLRNVHAPAMVHPAYRDVASALEDRERVIHEAEGFAAERLHLAAASAHRAVTEAEGEGFALVATASGRAAALEAFAQVWSDAPALTALRLRLEATERAFTGARLVAPLGPDVRIRTWAESRPGAKRTLPITTGGQDQ